MQLTVPLRKMTQTTKTRLRKALRWCGHNIVWLLLAECIFWSPVIVCAVLALIVSPWYWTACAGVIAFWAGPFTPAIPLQIALAGALKGAASGITHIVRYVHERRQRRWL